MEKYSCLLNKSVYNYYSIEHSLVKLNNYYNICFISSFYNGLKLLYPNIIPLEDIIPNIYPINKTNLYTNFSQDFYKIWNKLKTLLEIFNYDTENIILSIWLPLKNNKCINLVNIDMNKYDENIINSFIEEEFINLKNKKIINIVQYDNHFDSIIITNQTTNKYTDLDNLLNNLDIDHNFFN
jgi:hypothetical protein